MIYGNYLRDKYNNAAVKLANAKGYPCVFDNSKGRPLKDYKLYGNSIQDGIPSIENPIEVQSVGEKTRNIWYPSVDALKSNGITCTRNNDNTYTVNGTATADFYFHIGKITIEVGTTYYLSGGTSQAPIAFQLREGSTGVTTLYNHGGITTFSPTGEHSIDIINCVIAVRSGVEVNNVIVKPMISLENTDEYEPYGYKIPITASGNGKPITTNIYLDAPLRKVGNYADYIDFKHQKVVRNIFKHSLSVEGIYRKLNNVIRFNSTPYWDIHQKPDYNMRSTIFRNISSWHSEIENIFHHNGVNYLYYWSVYWHRLGLTYDGTNVYRTDDTKQTPLTDSEIINIAKQWLNTLSDKDKEIYMIRSKSTEKTITLPALKTFKGTNIISVDTNISPSNIQVQYIER